MKQKTKKIFFLILTVLFLITVFSVVSYSFGWRIDLKTGKITRPGAFYFKVSPRNVSIYINGRLKKKTDFLFGSSLIDNVMPGKYDVKIKKDGYYSWRKTLNIKPSQVTDAKAITLITKNPKIKFISDNSEIVFFSPTKEKFIIEEFSPKTNDPDYNENNNEINNSWSIKLFNIKENLKSQIISEKEIIEKIPDCYLKQKEKKTANLLDVESCPNSDKILLKISSNVSYCQEKNHIYYFLLDIDKTPPKLSFLSALEKENGLENVYFNNQNQKELILVTKEKKEGNNKDNLPSNKFEIKILSLTNKKISDPFLKNIIAWKITDKNIYYLDSSGFLFKENLFSRKQEKINTSPLDLRNDNLNNKIEIKVGNRNIALKKGNSLYVLSQEGFFEKISNNIKNFEFSPDFKKIAYLNEHSIWILYLRKKYDQPEKERGEKTFLTRFSENISNLSWYNNSYLIFNVGQKIKIAEIDDRDKINIVDLPNSYKSTTKNISPVKEKIFWDNLNNTLYITTKEGVIFSEKLTP